MCWKYSHKMFCEIIKKLVPERIFEIESLIAKHNIHFEAVEKSSKIRFCVNQQGTIRIYTQALSRFWAHTYAYYALYDYIQRNGWQRQIDFTNDKKAADAANLLSWAVNQDIKKIDTDTCSMYPNGHLSPFEVINGDYLTICARDITFYGLGYILLHEIAHLISSHSFDADIAFLIQQEYEADRWACHFVMDNIDDYITSNYPCDDSASKYIYDKRLLAIVASSYWLIKNECYKGVPLKITRQHLKDLIILLLNLFLMTIIFYGL